ncbi:unnamed protein product, partial [marine sediment metagenome]
ANEDACLSIALQMTGMLKLWNYHDEMFVNIVIQSSNGDSHGNTHVHVLLSMIRIVMSF